MSKCFEQARCNKDAAILRLSELAETYPLAAAFRFYELFLQSYTITPELGNCQIDAKYLRFVCNAAAVSRDFQVSNKYNHMAKYAHFLLGACYFYGHGEVTKNSWDSEKLMNLPSQVNYAPALNFLGATTYDENEAAKYYLQAARLNYAAAQNKIARYYWYGLGGVKRDREEAYRWYRVSAEQGYAPAQRALFWDQVIFCIICVKILLVVLVVVACFVFKK